MNAAVRAVVRTAAHHGVPACAIHEGLRGLVYGGDLIRPMTPADTGGILHRGGTVIGTARCKEFRTREGRRAAARNMVERGIDALVAIGGDGTMTIAHRFEEMGLPVVGVPKTIDNDLCHTDRSFGFDSAVAVVAEALDRPLSEVTRRAEALREVNPMLGMRGVRLGVVLPEIYDMQAQAIFEATLESARRGAPVVPEVMIPLVSARREVEMVKARIDGVAALVRTKAKADFDYKLGVMVETPRAALRAGEIAQHAGFLSFGTNDLTQMTYGLSRDDAGRFMRAYVNAGVFHEDPFHTLDLEGVGELMLIAARRGRESNPGLTLGLCGEHGGDPSSVRFCKLAGFNYVSCSPYRAPIARLAAAQATILARGEAGGSA